MTISLERIHRIHLKGDLERAEALYRKYLVETPPDPHSQHLMGTLLLQQGQNGRAVRHFRRAMEMRKFPADYINIMVALRALGRAEEAIELGEEALYLWGEREPKLKNFYSNFGSCYMELGEYDKADAIYRILLEDYPDDPDANWNHGICLLSQGNFAEGWPGFDYGFKARERGAPPYFDEFPEWLGEELADKTILVWGEQGIGDEILFATMLPDLIKDAGRVIFDCHPRLERLFARSLDCEVVGGRKSKLQGRWDHEHIDYHVPIGSLGRFYRNFPEDFGASGILIPDHDRVAQMRREIPGFKVGLAWRGGVQKTGTNRRSIPLEKLLPPPLEGVTYVSLQYGNVYEEVSQFPVYHNEAYIEDFDELANLTAACDLVISVIQTQVHLAGELGVPTWCLTPQAPAWKFNEGERMLWHTSVKQYHQKDRDDWKPVLDKVHSDLAALVQRKAA